MLAFLMYSMPSNKLIFLHPTESATPATTSTSTTTDSTTSTSRNYSNSNSLWFAGDWLSKRTPWKYFCV